MRALLERFLDAVDILVLVGIIARLRRNRADALLEGIARMTLLRCFHNTLVGTPELVFEHIQDWGLSLSGGVRSMAGRLYCRLDHNRRPSLTHTTQTRAHVLLSYV